MASQTVPPTRSSDLHLPTSSTRPSIPWDTTYIPITHKEKLAIKTMESIPGILRDANQLRLEHPVSPTMYFSPSQLPLQDRMAVIFSRVMARARMEADSGDWTFDIAAGIGSSTTATTTTILPDAATATAPLTAPVTPAATTTPATDTEKKGFQSSDVMSSQEAEEFLANIEVVHVDVNGVTKWFRRYYRVIKPGKGRKEDRGAVRAAAVQHTLPAFVMPSIGQRMKRAEGEERAVVADIELDAEGVGVLGWWNDKLHHHEPAPVPVVAARRTGKWAPIPLRLVKNSR